MRLAILLACLAASLATSASAAECTVADPTGTPLNVRAAPNGAVLSTLENGTLIEVIGETTHQGKRWLHVADMGDEIGWVFARFVICPRTKAQPKSAPMKPRDAPQE